MINVTKTFLPPKTEYEKIIGQIWKSNQIANGGVLHQKLIKSLQNYLNISNIVLTANGTLPLQIVLKSMAKQGEVITTPFSYVATTSSIVWENCTPVFVDISPNSLCIEASKIENAITKKTTAILATHVFGNPCELEEIEKIAKNYDLKVIYDAAHCFGVKYRGKSIFNFGDVSTCSFHATKLFHTGEGGATFCKDNELFQELFYRHNFGHKGKIEFQGLGINAKLSELQAGMGLAVLPYVFELIESNKIRTQLYDKYLDFEKVRKPVQIEGVESNFNYYPLIFPNESILKEVLSILAEKEIYPRRYFYPSLNNLPFLKYKEMPVSEDIASRILCMPLYSELKFTDIKLICDLVNSKLKDLKVN
ncbi:DegT/DnrJ/EryC1/StrS family aminotransferase [Gramella sp. BOM4]|nr:DegT/DnrJ/EryC1/StrS family aminotransferase [Christiangramia bathymodioli]